MGRVSGEGEAGAVVTETASEDETRALGRALGETLEAGDLVGIEGPLGAGKTRFVDGACAGLGVPKGEVASPTYALVNTYQGRLPVYHVDLYRVEDADEVEATGILDVLEGGVALVEWIERVPALMPARGVHVRIEDLGGDRRRVTVDDRRGAR